ncbi:inositol-phosphate phosphatase, putative [Plasmodium ovale wallikeri]|uniref:phosphoinositide 5-phosphatase n=1 Tax=Plasmodium ovale wallikeri TaxID=864142 RepID=A0A1A8YHK3_PLAOA|nr:inositol-phosphate phosphatase, putative [Plasmodium ovale wallikeri]
MNAYNTEGRYLLIIYEKVFKIIYIKHLKDNKNENIKVPSLFIFRESGKCSEKIISKDNIRKKSKKLGSILSELIIDNIIGTIEIKNELFLFVVEKWKLLCKFFYLRKYRSIYKIEKVHYIPYNINIIQINTAINNSLNIDDNSNSYFINDFKNCEDINKNFELVNNGELKFVYKDGESRGNQHTTINTVRETIPIGTVDNLPNANSNDMSCEFYSSGNEMDKPYKIGEENFYHKYFSNKVIKFDSGNVQGNNGNGNYNRNINTNGVLREGEKKTFVSEFEMGGDHLVNSPYRINSYKKEEKNKKILNFNTAKKWLTNQFNHKNILNIISDITNYDGRSPNEGDNNKCRSDSRRSGNFNGSRETCSGGHRREQEVNTNSSNLDENEWMMHFLNDKEESALGSSNMRSVLKIMNNSADGKVGNNPNGSSIETNSNASAWGDHNRGRNDHRCASNDSDRRGVRTMESKSCNRSDSHSVHRSGKMDNFRNVEDGDYTMFQNRSEESKHNMHCSKVSINLMDSLIVNKDSRNTSAYASERKKCEEKCYDSLFYDNITKENYTPERDTNKYFERDGDKVNKDGVNKPTTCDRDVSGRSVSSSEVHQREKNSSSDIKDLINNSYFNAMGSNQGEKRNSYPLSFKSGNDDNTTKTDEKKMNLRMDIYKMLKTIQKILSVHMYYSYDYDLTQCIQKKMRKNIDEVEYEPLSAPSLNKKKTFLKVSEKNFMWNYQMIKKVKNKCKIDNNWFCSVIQGYISYTSIEINKKCLELLLISRRSSILGGTRFNKRGINDDGYVANYVETEQIIRINNRNVAYKNRFDRLGDVQGGAYSERRSGMGGSVCDEANTDENANGNSKRYDMTKGNACSGDFGNRNIGSCSMGNRDVEKGDSRGGDGNFEDRIISLVQIRGSVPLFWKQHSMSSHVNIQRSSLLSIKAFKEHNKKLITNYGNNIYYINLLSQSKGNEKKLTKKMVELINYIKKDKHYKEKEYINYIEYDFHISVKNKSFEDAMNDFINKVLLKEIKNVSFFMEPTREVHGNDVGRCIGSSATGECSALQNGVFRTNCLDCLDRTNVFQYYYTLFFILYVLHVSKNDIFLRPVKKSHLCFYKNVNSIFNSKNVTVMSTLQMENYLLEISDKYGVNKNYEPNSSRVINPSSGTMVGDFYYVSDIAKSNIPRGRSNNHVVSRMKMEMEERKHREGFTYEKEDTDDNKNRIEHLDEYIYILKHLFKKMWVENGDIISTHYTGTGSVFSSQINVGRSSLSTNIDHAIKSIERFYQNNFEDNFRQECIDIILCTGKYSRNKKRHFIGADLNYLLSYSNFMTKDSFLRLRTKNSHTHISYVHPTSSVEMNEMLIEHEKESDLLKRKTEMVGNKNKNKYKLRQRDELNSEDSNVYDFAHSNSATGKKPGRRRRIMAENVQNKKGTLPGESVKEAIEEAVEDGAEVGESKGNQTNPLKRGKKHIGQELANGAAKDMSNDVHFKTDNQSESTGNSSDSSGSSHSSRSSSSSSSSCDRQEKKKKTKTKKRNSNNKKGREKKNKSDVVYMKNLYKKKSYLYGIRSRNKYSDYLNQDLINHYYVDYEDSKIPSNYTKKKMTKTDYEEKIVKLWAGTWNLCGNDLYELNDISSWLNQIDEYIDIYVFCFQEVVELTGFRILMNMKDKFKEKKIEQKITQSLAEISQRQKELYIRSKSGSSAFLGSAEESRRGSGGASTMAHVSDHGGVRQANEKPYGGSGDDCYENYLKCFDESYANEKVDEHSSSRMREKENLREEQHCNDNNGLLDISKNCFLNNYFNNLNDDNNPCFNDDLLDGENPSNVHINNETCAGSLKKDDEDLVFINDKNEEMKGVEGSMVDLDDIPYGNHANEEIREKNNLLKVVREKDNNFLSEHHMRSNDTNISSNINELFDNTQPSNPIRRVNDSIRNRDHFNSVENVHMVNDSEIAAGKSSEKRQTWDGPSVRSKTSAHLSRHCIKEFTQNGGDCRHGNMGGAASFNISSVQDVFEEDKKGRLNNILRMRKHGNDEEEVFNERDDFRSSSRNLKNDSNRKVGESGQPIHRERKTAERMTSHEDSSSQDRHGSHSECAPDGGEDHLKGERVFLRNASNKYFLNLKRFKYVKLKSVSMIGLFIIIFIDEGLVDYIREIEVCKVKVGLKGNTGNKGSVSIKFRLGFNSFCFNNIHLASGQTNMFERNSQMQNILNNSFQNQEYNNLFNFDYFFACGDFNFRINKSHEEVFKTIASKNAKQLLNYDQFIYNKLYNILPFCLFYEHPIMFNPTYKYKKNSNMYDVRRTPAWYVPGSHDSSPARFGVSQCVSVRVSVCQCVSVRVSVYERSCDRILVSGKLIHLSELEKKRKEHVAQASKTDKVDGHGNETKNDNDNMSISRNNEIVGKQSDSDDLNEFYHNDKIYFKYLNYKTHNNFFSSDHKPVSAIIELKVFFDKKEIDYKLLNSYSIRTNDEFNHLAKNSSNTSNSNNNKNNNILDYFFPNSYGISKYTAYPISQILNYSNTVNNKVKNEMSEQPPPDDETKNEDKVEEHSHDT